MIKTFLKWPPPLGFEKDGDEFYVYGIKFQLICFTQLWTLNVHLVLFFAFIIKACAFNNTQNINEYWNENKNAFLQ